MVQMRIIKFGEKKVMYYHAKKMARRVLIFNFGGISNSGFRARHISVVAGKRPKLLDNSQSKHIFTWKIAKKCSAF